MSDAYRENYSAENMADATIWEAASRLRKNPKVTARLEQLQAQAAERTLVTVERLTLELEAARKLAMGDAKAPAAAVNAIMGKAKLHGLLTDKVDVNTPPARDVFHVVVPGINKLKPNGPRRGG